ncbi:MAG: glycosyltransferase, partial [Magnetococcales bacterium]|nr:glycosyltransferase [Magnetococcales bacterium]
PLTLPSPLPAEAAPRPEWVVDPERMQLTEPRELDPEALAETIRELLDDRTMAQRLGENLERRVREKFSLEGYARRLEAVYDRVFAEASDTA